MKPITTMGFRLGSWRFGDRGQRHDFGVGPDQIQLLLELLQARELS